MNIENNHNSEFIDLDEFIPIQGKQGIDITDQAAVALYKENLNSLGKYHPELVEIIESINLDNDKVEVINSESGHPRLVFNREDGERVSIHSADDPVACANQAIDLLGKIEKEGMVVLFGFGLGYFAEEVHKRIEKGHIVLIYEATGELFKAALHIKDFTELFKSEQVKIIIGKNADNFSVLHSHHHLIVNGKFWIIKHHPSVNLNTEAYDRFYKRLNEEKRMTDSGVATVVGRGKEFINAFLQAAPSIIRKPGVTKLKNIFKGHPAIVVSAGTSLDKNIHLLKKAKGKAIIIAVDGALPSLLMCNVIPDIVVAVDPVSENIDDKFMDIPILKNVPFICLAQYTPDLINLYPGPLFINGVPQNIAYNWLLPSMGDRGHIETYGGSVAHLALATAEYVGANIITFVGQDLSYAGDRVHTKGYSDVLDVALLDSKSRGLSRIPGALQSTDIFGNEVDTIPQFLSFKTAFENRIKQFEGTVINSTEGGLPLDGAVNMRLADFFDEYCNDITAIDTFAILSGFSSEEIDYHLDGLYKTVKETRDRFAKIKNNSRVILKYIDKLNALKKNGSEDSEEFHNILAKVESLSNKGKHPMLDLLAGYHYGLELYLKRQDIKDVDDIEDMWEKLDKQLERGKNYYSELNKAIELFNKQLKKLLNGLLREKKIDSILSDKSLGNRDKYLQAGKIYWGEGLAVQAVKYIEKAIDLKETDSEDQDDKHESDSERISLQVVLSELYISQFRYYEAREMLKTLADETAADLKYSVKVKSLLKKCDEKISSWTERKKNMQQSFNDAEKNYGSDLDSGYFYFRIKDFKRAEKAYEKAVNNCLSTQYSGNDKALIVEAYYGLAHSYLEMNKEEKAVEVLEKAMNIDPTNPAVYLDLGLIAIQNNNIEPAELLLLKAIELAPSEEALYRPLAGLYMSLGESKKAVALYENALKANQDNPAIQKELAMLINETISEHNER